MIAVSHQDDVEVVNSETRIFPGDQVIVAADTDLLARARESCVRCNGCRGRSRDLC